MRRRVAHASRAGIPGSNVQIFSDGAFEQSESWWLKGNDSMKSAAVPWERIHRGREEDLNRTVKARRIPSDMRNMTERRSEVRMLCADLVDLCWRDPAGKKGHVTALLEDISASGACFQLEAPMELGSEVEWRSPKRGFSGVVRYCVYREIGYFVGIELLQSSKWNRRAFKPQHLLDLQRLVAQSSK